MSRKTGESRKTTKKGPLEERARAGARLSSVVICEREEQRKIRHVPLYSAA